MTDDKRVSDFIFQQHDKGASAQKVAANLELTHHRARQVFNRLLEAGEIFQKGKVYCSTAWFMAFKPEPMIEKIKNEIERAVFKNNGMPPQVEALLEEYTAARALKLSKLEAWELAKRKMQGVG